MTEKIQVGPLERVARIVTLGLLDVRDASGESVASVVRHHKRLALLAYLALAGEGRTRSRDSVLSLFWAEADGEHARAALNQTVYAIRAVLGKDVFASRRSDLGLEAERVVCDAVEFEAALERGDRVAALELYGGDFLPGLFVEGALDLMLWIDQERLRLRRAASAAALSLAEAGAGGLAAQGDVIRWARRGAELSFDMEEAVRRAMTLIAEVGDRAAAISAYEAFANRLAVEMDLAPAPGTRALAARLRGRTEPAPSRRAAPAPTTASAAETVAEREPSASAAPAAAAASVPASAPAAPPRRRRGWRVAAWAAAVVVVVAIGVTWVSRQTRSAPAQTVASGSSVVLDVPRFNVLRGPQEAGSVLRTAVLDALSESSGLLVKPGEAEAGATASGADAYRLVVDVMEASRGWTVSLRLTHAGSGEIVATRTMQVPEPDLRQLAEAAPGLSHDVRVAIGRDVRLRRWRERASSDRSWQLFEEGTRDVDRAYRFHASGSAPLAARATRLADSLFSLSAAADPRAVFPLLGRARAKRAAGELVLASGTPDFAAVRAAMLEANDITSQALRLDPTDPDVLEERSKANFWLGILPSTPVSEARGALSAAENDVRHLLRRDADRASAWWALARILNVRGDFAAAYLAARHAYDADAFQDHRLELLAQLYRDAFETRDDSAAADYCSRMRIEYPHAVPTVTCSLESLARADGGPAPGDVDAAWNVLAGLSDPGPGWHRAQLSLLVASVAARAGLRDSARAVIRRSRRAYPGDESLVLEAEARLALGDAESAIDLLRTYIANFPLRANVVEHSRRFASISTILVSDTLIAR